MSAHGERRNPEFLLSFNIPAAVIFMRESGRLGVAGASILLLKGAGD